MCRYMCACVCSVLIICVFFFKQKTAYEMRISDWSSDVCSSDLPFAGRVLQPLDFVEVVVVELLVQRPERGLDVAEVHHPAAVGARLAGDMQLDHERMPVQPRALVARRHVRQPVRGFDGEGLEDVHGRHSTAGTAPPTPAEGGS